MLDFFISIENFDITNKRPRKFNEEAKFRSIGREAKEVELRVEKNMKEGAGIGGFWSARFAVPDFR